MGIEQLFERYGFWALLLFVILDKGTVLLNKYLPYINGQQMKKLEMLEEESDRKHDLEERSVIATEQIAKTMILIAERLDRLEDGERTIMNALNETNKSLAVLVDRQTAHRKPQPTK